MYNNLHHEATFEGVTRCVIGVLPQYQLREACIDNRERAATSVGDRLGPHGTDPAGGATCGQLQVR
jgi:hypothetical protein